MRPMESSLVVWLCDEKSDEFDREQDRLRQLVYPMKAFDDRNACRSFISNVQDEKIFLLVYGKCSSFDWCDHLPQLEKIYFLGSTSLERAHAKHICIRDVDMLTSQLRHDIESCESDLIRVSSIPQSSREISLTSHFTKQEATFVFIQCVREICNRLKFGSGSKDVLVEFCRLHYADNDHQLRAIDEFAENYRPNKALWWLLHQTFVSKMLERVQRTSEIDILYKLGFFIKHINLQLLHLAEENGQATDGISAVYRGKTMSAHDFAVGIKENTHGLLLFNTFLRASIQQDVAVDFIRRRLAVHPEMLGVLFQFDIDRSSSNEVRPFALLNNAETQTDQICFDATAVFRIESVVQRTDILPALWVVTLKPVRDDDKQLNHLLTSIRVEDFFANPIPYLCRLLMDMGEFRRAEQCFLGLLEDASVVSQPHRLVRVHNGLATNYSHRGEYAKALVHFQQALETILLYLPPDHPDLAPIYQAIGNSYLNQCDYGSAIEHYEKAMGLLRSGVQPVGHGDMLTDLQVSLNKARQSSTVKH